MAQYEIYKRTTAGKRGTLIEEYNTFEAVLRFNEIGKWSLTSRGSSLCPFSENEGIIVYRNGVALLSGYITNITEDADESHPESALITWNVEGLEDTGMLQRRIIYPDPVNLTFTTADFHTITDYAGNAILTYIDKHAGSGAHADRKVPNLVIDALSNLGDSATYKGRFEVLWDFIIAIANTADLGVRVVWDGSTGNAEAQVYEPSDKSTTVIFSRDFGNLKGWKRKRTAPSGNVIVAGGEGEGVDRLMSVVSDSASVTKWGRTEQFLDSGVSTEQDDEDPRTPTQMNEDEATAKLTDSAATDGYELNIIDVDRMQYKTDWDLGDKVSIRIGNTSFTQNIKEVKITYAGTIEKITPSVGTIDKGNLATIFTALQETEARVTALEAKESAVFPLVNNAGAHNSIYRGASLGTSVSAAQYTAIAAGTFDDMYVGDYWTINSVVWRIAAFDYYLTTGDTACNTHHVVIVPDTNLYSHVMNNTNITTGGYVGSKMYTQGLAQALSTIETAFGASHILSHRQYLCNAVTGGYPSGGSWYDSKVELMTEQNVYGNKVMSPMGNGATVVANYTVDKSQYPLFVHDPHMISNRQTFWLRDVVSAANFALVSVTGYAYYNGASYAYGVRPAFSIIG